MSSIGKHCQIGSSKQIHRKHFCTCTFRACIAYSRSVLAHSEGNRSSSFALLLFIHNFGGFVWSMAPPKLYVLSIEMAWSSRKHALRVMPMAVPTQLSNNASPRRLNFALARSHFRLLFWIVPKAVFAVCAQVIVNMRSDAVRKPIQCKFWRIASASEVQ